MSGSTGNADNDNVAMKFTGDGKFVMQIGKIAPTKGSNDTTQLGKPAEITFDKEANELYVADGYGNRRVIVFDADDRRLQAALGRLRQAAERRQAGALRSQGAGSRSSSAIPCTA